MPLDLSPLWISLRVASLATGLAFCAGIAAAYAMLGYRGPAKSWIEGILVAPLVLPPTVVGFLLLMVLGRNSPMGSALQSLGLNLVFTWYGAVTAATVVAFPLMYRTALGSFQQIDPDLLQVAHTLGAQDFRVFCRILLPLSMPGLLAGLTLSFARALGEFGATLMVAGNIPGRTQTMPMAIYFAVQAGAMPEAWFWVAIILLVSLSSIIAANLWQAQWQQYHALRPPALQASQAIGSLDQGTRAIDSAGMLTRLPVIDPPIPLASPPSLHVNIHKALATFSLRVAFDVGSDTQGILGASGSGKSMLLRCIAGVETPTSGQIVLNGRVLFDHERGINLPSHQRRVGLLFQNYALFPHLTIADNIAFGLQHLTKIERLQRVNAWLRVMQLEGGRDRYPQQLSGGQQQRVALARALAPDPEVLLLDEPLSALDTYLRSQVEKHLIGSLARYRGIALFVTHNLEEIFRVCPQIMVMSEGQPVVSGSKHEVFAHPGRVITAELTGCKNFSRATQSSARMVKAEDWGSNLEVTAPIPQSFSQVGFRAHHIQFVQHSALPNTFRCWVVATRETPHRITLFLKLHHPPDKAEVYGQPSADYHLQAELFQEKWQTLKQQPMPWYVHLRPDQVLLLSE